MLKKYFIFLFSYLHKKKKKKKQKKNSLTFRAEGYLYEICNFSSLLSKE